MATRHPAGKTCMEVIHQPRLDTVLMVENTIRKMKVYPNKMQLWKALPKQVMYQTFNVILKYLEKSGKIVFKGNKIIWIWDPEAIKRLLSSPGLIVR